MTSLNDYAIQRRLGHGGMAEIFLAHKRGLQGFEKPVVLKRILPHLAQDPGWVEMFLDEARIAAGLTHPNIPQIFELGAEDGEYFIVMEYIEGKDLALVLDKLEERGEWLSIGQALTIVLGVAEALDYAHNRRGGDGRRVGLVHRDVSPHNIMIATTGTVKLIDFGIAKSKQKIVQTDEGSFKGKMEYAAPEQIGGSHIDRRADIFSLGSVLFELLFARPAYPQEGIIPRLGAMHRAAWTEQIPVDQRADLAPALRTLLERCLHPDREHRYSRARHVIAAINQHLDDTRQRVPALELSRAMHLWFADGTAAHPEASEWATMSAQAESAFAPSTLAHARKKPPSSGPPTGQVKPLTGQTQVEGDPIHSAATEIKSGDGSDVTTGPSRGAIPPLYGLHSLPDEETDPRRANPWDEAPGFIPEPTPLDDPDARRTQALPVRPRRNTGRKTVPKKRKD